jgi:hypothetical protein
MEQLIRIKTDDDNVENMTKTLELAGIKIRSTLQLIRCIDKIFSKLRESSFR